MVCHEIGLMDVLNSFMNLEFTLSLRASFWVYQLSIYCAA